VGNCVREVQFFQAPLNMFPHVSPKVTTEDVSIRGNDSKAEQSIHASPMSITEDVSISGKEVREEQPRHVPRMNCTEEVSINGNVGIFTQSLQAPSLSPVPVSRPMSVAPEVSSKGKLIISERPRQALLKSVISPNSSFIRNLVSTRKSLNASISVFVKNLVDISISSTGR